MSTVRKAYAPLSLLFLVGCICLGPTIRASDDPVVIDTNRETLEIKVGGGGVSYPAVLSPHGAPSPFPENEEFPPLPSPLLPPHSPLPPSLPPSFSYPPVLSPEYEEAPAPSPENEEYTPLPSPSSSSPSPLPPSPLSSISYPPVPSPEYEATAPSPKNEYYTPPPSPLSSISYPPVPSPEYEAPAPSPNEYYTPPQSPPLLSPSPSPSSLPPPSPAPSPPSPFDSPRLEIVYPIIQAFKKRIITDPKGITKSWKGNKICENYMGFSCSTVPDRNQTALAVVNFNGFGLGGNLTGFIENLEDIAVFHANSNNFTGTIPKDISNLRYLYELDLSNNKYYGEFPMQVFGATKLTFLDLRFNKFVGFVPPQLFLLDVDVLFINNNNFIQKLPHTLGNTPALYLTLANNKFTGPIPSSIGKAKETLVEVLFLNNQLSGCLPYEIGHLKYATVFDVGFNHLTGPIPYSFACLRKMQQLNLAVNRFYGEVPEMVCKLPNLMNLSLSYNYFTQVGKECRKLIEKKVLDVKMNCILDLPHQRSPADCAAFFSKTTKCHRENKFCIIPCKSIYNQPISSNETSSPLPAPVGSPISYDALAPIRL